MILDSLISLLLFSLLLTETKYLKYILDRLYDSLYDRMISIFEFKDF